MPRLPVTKKYLLLFSLILSFGIGLKASHIRGGYISAKRLSGYRYEFLLTVYRDKASEITDDPNRLYPDASISDVLVSPLIRPVYSIPGKQTDVCQYRFEYTYKSPGVYTAYHFQLFRNRNILNMDNSDQTTFYVETKVIIDPFGALDQSPVITKAAVDYANIGTVYRYNPGAFDPDGDSISYKLVPSRQFLQGQGRSATVTNYRDPAVRSGGLDSSNGIPANMTLNEATGDLVWNVPRVAGEFNTAIKIIQWRKFRANRAQRDSIGYVILDIQIIVKDTRNKRPILKLPRDTCVVAGAFLRSRIEATDPDVNDRINITFYGELDTLLPATRRATFNPVRSFPQPAYGDFEWSTNCNHVRTQPYYALFDAEDVPFSGGFPLVDARVWRIKVVGPSPVLRKIEPSGRGGLRIAWDPYVCPNASRMRIYRKIDSTEITLDTCDPGMPASAGYVIIGDVPATDTSYLDNNNGLGLRKGPGYCYRIVAVFPEPAGGESLVSNEVCRPLELDIPVMLQVDVNKTGTTDGEINLKWTKPFSIDSQAYNPPYTVEIFRNLPGEKPILIRTTTNTSDTTFVDSGLDTRNRQYQYQLKFRYGDGANLVDSTPIAESVRLDLSPGIKRITLQWRANTPWSNQGFYHRIFREIQGSYVLIDSVLSGGASNQYTDEGKFQNIPLSDTSEYCYYVETVGTYSNPRIFSPLVNRSERICASPTDTIKPCQPPDLVVENPQDFSCDNCAALAQLTEFSRTIRWRSVQKDTCGQDVRIYRIYFSEHEEDPVQLLSTTIDTFFVHSSLSNLAGCYAVTAVDRSGNESTIVQRTCVDNCIEFRLPNLITPDGNELNDLFTPSCVSKAFIENVHFTVYNRWGKVVFEDNVSPEINWSGTSEGNSGTVVPGVYFFHAAVKAKRLNRRNENMKFTGWVEVAK